MASDKFERSRMKVHEIIKRLHSYIAQEQELRVANIWMECPLSLQLELIQDQLDRLRTATTEGFIETTKLLQIMVSFGAGVDMQQYIVDQIQRIRYTSVHAQICKTCIKILMEYHTRSFRDRILPRKVEIRRPLAQEWRGIVTRSRTLAVKMNKYRPDDLKTSDFEQCVDADYDPIKVYRKRVDIRIFPTLFIT